MGDSTYTGNELLEVLEHAAGYRAWLTGYIDELGRRAGSRSLVDFGAGIGTYPRDARELGYDVTCVELDPEQRERLSGDGFTALQSLDELPEATAPAVYSLNVLEHIPDDSAALGDILRVTQPGGHLLLVVPAFPVLFNNMDRLVGHHRRYRRKPLLRLLQSSGWVVDHCRYGDSLGFPAALAYRLLGRFASGDIRPGQVRLYVRLLFPLSRRLDALFGHLFGKNLVVFAHRPEGDTAAE